MRSAFYAFYVVVLTGLCVLFVLCVVGFIFYTIVINSLGLLCFLITKAWNFERKLNLAHPH
jgi:hypothetical protein